MPTSYAGVCPCPWNSSNYSSGPGSYVSGSSVRSASTSLDGVVAAWSASVDAASLLPGTCCICPESHVRSWDLANHDTLSDIMKWTKWANIWNASAAVRHLLFYLCGYCGLVEPVRTNALYQKPLAVAIRCDSLPRMDLLVHLILEQWIASTSFPWQHLALQPSVRWDIPVRPNSTCNALQLWNFVGDLLISFSNVLHMLANLTWQAAARPLQLLGSGMNRFECV